MKTIILIGILCLLLLAGCVPETPSNEEIGKCKLTCSEFWLVYEDTKVINNETNCYCDGKDGIEVFTWK